MDEEFNTEPTTTSSANSEDILISFADWASTQPEYGSMFSQFNSLSSDFASYQGQLDAIQQQYNASANDAKTNALASKRVEEQQMASGGGISNASLFTQDQRLQDQYSNTLQSSAESLQSSSEALYDEMNASLLQLNALISSSESGNAYMEWASTLTDDEIDSLDPTGEFGLEAARKFGEGSHLWRHIGVSAAIGLGLMFALPLAFEGIGLVSASAMDARRARKVSKRAIRGSEILAGTAESGISGISEEIYAAKKGAKALKAEELARARKEAQTLTGTESLLGTTAEEIGTVVPTQLVDEAGSVVGQLATPESLKEKQFLDAIATINENPNWAMMLRAQDEAVYNSALSQIYDDVIANGRKGKKGRPRKGMTGQLDPSMSNYPLTNKELRSRQRMGWENIIWDKPFSYQSADHKIERIGPGVIDPRKAETIYLNSEKARAILERQQGFLKQTLEANYRSRGKNPRTADLLAKRDIEDLARGAYRGPETQNGYISRLSHMFGQAEKVPVMKQPKYLPELKVGTKYETSGILPHPFRLVGKTAFGMSSAVAGSMFLDLIWSHYIDSQNLGLFNRTTQYGVKQFEKGENTNGGLPRQLNLMANSVTSDYNAAERFFREIGISGGQNPNTAGTSSGDGGTEEPINNNSKSSKPSTGTLLGQLLDSLDRGA